MKHLVTGGAGFIGRWVVRRLLELGESVVAFDDYSNSHPRNLAEFSGNRLLTVLKGDVKNAATLNTLWSDHGPFDVVSHLAASVRVQDSIDDPRPTFENDTVGTFEVLERCRRQYFELNGITPGKPFHRHEREAELQRRSPRFVFMSTCMVYGRANGPEGMTEAHPTRPASPYAASKIASENLTLSYGISYGMPVKIVRPFNTYGPFQKRNLEGGVVAIFIARDLAGQPLLVKGDGAQTRDLLYVEDCARFVVEAGRSDRGDGEVLNAGLGQDISIADLARLVQDPAKGGKGVAVQHVAHDHPQAEIAKLLCDSRRAGHILGWKSEISLEEGIRRTREWIRLNQDAL